MSYPVDDRDGVAVTVYHVDAVGAGVHTGSTTINTNTDGSNDGMLGWASWDTIDDGDGVAAPVGHIEEIRVAV